MHDRLSVDVQVESCMQTSQQEVTAAVESARLSLSFAEEGLREDMGALRKQLEDLIVVKSKIKSMSKSSFVMEQLIEKDGNLASEAEVVLVTVNSSGKPVKIPEILAKQLT